MILSMTRRLPAWRWTRFSSLTRLISSVAALLLLGAVTPAQAAWDQLNMPEGVTSVSQEIFALHMLILWICVVIGIIVFGVMGYAMIAFRRRVHPTPSKVHENAKLELLWTIIPVLILVGMAVPSVATLRDIYDESPGDINIEVIGYQWKWEYRYQEDGISFFSNLLTSKDQIDGRLEKSEFYLVEVDEPVVVPIGKRIRFLVTASDVLHSWWVPDFGIKRDAVPGYVNATWIELDKPGVYRGQCTELCGKDHGFMPIVVHAVSQADYDAWVAEKIAEREAIAALVAKDWTEDELMALGGDVFNKTCAACHLPSGEGIAGIFPSLVGTPIAVGALDNIMDVVVNGRQGTAMQAFGAQLKETELAAALTYVRRSWGNDAATVETGSRDVDGKSVDGSIVLPIEVYEFKSGGQ